MNRSMPMGGKAGRAGPDVNMSKESRNAVLKRIASYLLAHKGMVLLCFLLMLLSNLLSLATPKLSQRAIDAIEPGVGKVHFEAVFFYCGLMLLFYS
ncbi:MAG: ABC transporter ATP-binding protein, partial [Clostridia bacterium]|nr:ABC transporter ATP-binding protein [Clostridia bacterium]